MFSSKIIDKKKYLVQIQNLTFITNSKCALLEVSDIIIHLSTSISPIKLINKKVLMSFYRSIL